MTMKHVTILYFASAKEATLVSEEQMSFNQENLNQLIECCVKRYPKLQNMIHQCIFSVNLEFVSKEDAQALLIQDQDEIAFIPPVSGG